MSLLEVESKEVAASFVVEGGFLDWTVFAAVEQGGLRFGLVGWESKESGTEKQEQHRGMLVGGCVPSKLVLPSL